MATKMYPIKIDGETRKALELRQTKFKQLVKKFTGKDKSIPLTKVLKISVKNPIEVNYFEAAHLQRKLTKKRGGKNDK
jgi:hypothetical protein